MKTKQDTLMDDQDKRLFAFCLAAISRSAGLLNERIFLGELTVEEACREFLEIQHGKREYEKSEIEEAEKLLLRVGRIEDWEVPPNDPRRKDVSIPVVEHGKIYLTGDSQLLVMYNREADLFYDKGFWVIRGVDCRSLRIVPCPFTGKGGAA